MADSAAAAQREAESSRRGPAFVVAALAGTLVAAWGAHLYLDATPDAGRRWALLTWLVGADVLHDAVLAPVTCLAGLVLVRPLPRWLRAPVRAGLVGTATVLVLAWLPLHDTAAAARNETIQPLDYTSATLTAVALVWILVASTLAFEVGRARRRDRLRPR